jgi:hypothetical protein
MSESDQINWYDIAPADAVDIDLSVRLDIKAPLNEEGIRCPWPWDPQQLVDAPMGQYRCGYCGAMVMAGMPHIDYREKHEQIPAKDNMARTVIAPESDTLSATNSCQCMMQDLHEVGSEECIYERPGGETLEDSP